MSTTSTPTRSFWLALILLVGVALAVRLSLVNFSLPYVDHPDEPNFYLAGLEWRGLWDNDGYYEGYPPYYLVLQTALQPLLEWAGQNGLANNVRVFRVISAVMNSATLAFILLTLRAMGSHWVGWVSAGLIFALAPIIVEHGIFAIPDPAVYGFSAATVWVSVEALRDPRRAHWAIWGMALAFTAVMFKYPALPIMGVPALVTLVYLVREPRKGLTLLGWQVAILLINGAWFGYYMATSQPKDFDEYAVVKDGGYLNTLFNLDWIGNNLYHLLNTPNLQLVSVTLGVGALAWGIARWRKVQQVDLGMVALMLFVVISIPWIVAGFIRIDAGQIRHVMAATPALVILLGLAVGQVAHLLPRRGQWIGLAVSVSAIVWLNGLPTLQFIQTKRLPDMRVELRQWFDANLEAGTVLVTVENHKTFNPIWGGIPHLQWVDWVETSDFTQQTAQAWREQGITYATIPSYHHDALQQTESGRAFLEASLPLRTFVDANDVPQLGFYRVWRAEVETDVRFGDAIRLIGYDAIPSTAASGEAIPLRFYWRADTPPVANYSLFVHWVASGETAPLAQLDGNPSAPNRLTQTWTDPTETLMSPRWMLPVATDTPSGRYDILIGLYDFATGQRLSVNGQDHHRLATVEVQ